MDYKTITFDLDELRQFGIEFLTGESNGIWGMSRVLCDLTTQGFDIIRSFFGLPDNVILANNWNNGEKDNPHIYSIMLPTSIIKDLIIFCYLTQYKYVYEAAMFSDNRPHYATNLEHKDFEEKFDLQVIKSYYFIGTAQDKSRCTHIMSRREI